MSRLQQALLALVALVELSAPALAGGAPVEKAKFVPVLVAESKSKSLCEDDPGRIFVKYSLGSECIAYYVTPGLEAVPRAVLFFDGDAASPDYADPDKQTLRLEHKRRLLDKWSATMKVRYVYVSRVGLNGSSGNHGNRLRPNEMLVMEAAVDILKQRLGLTTIALAGQSRGSTIAASLLTRGRSDVACTVLGSGAYEMTDLEYESFQKSGIKVTKEQVAKALYDPSEHIDGIRKDPNRRIFLLGDANDQRAPIDQQIRFTDQIEAAGHHVRFAFIEARDEMEHGAMNATIPVAGACMKGWSDDRIVAAVRPKKGVKVSTVTP